MPNFKLVNFSQLNGPPTVGLLIGEFVYDLKAAMLATEHSVNFNPHDTNSVLEEWDRVRPMSLS